MSHLLTSQPSAPTVTVKAQFAATRTALLADLRALGVMRIELNFVVYDNSGDVESVDYTPPNVVIAGELNGRVEEFGWNFTEFYYSSFEDCCSVSGCFDWALGSDEIGISHLEHDLNGEADKFED